MRDITANEQRILREVYEQKAEFREHLAALLEQKVVMCPRCFGFEADLHTVPSRLAPFMGFRDWGEVCVRCLAEASTLRNRQIKQERQESDGVIVFDGKTRLGVRGALSSRPDLDGKGGQVYLARYEKVIKIGATTRGAHNRITQLGGGGVYQLIVTLSLNTPFALERYLHQRFARFRDKGEYFKLEPHHLEFVRNIRQFNGQRVVVEVVSG